MKAGILTAGGDCPGVNAAIRGFGKAAISTYGMELVAFRDGFTGLVEDRTLDLNESGALSGILTLGGTILGTSKVLPQKMSSDNQLKDRTEDAIATYQRHGLDALVTVVDQESLEAAYALSKAGLNIVAIPRSAENDIPATDKSIGFDTAREIATEAIDRLHTNANSTHRLMIVELLGRKSGWLTLGAGLAAGADVILIPEIPYDIEVVTRAILRRKQEGRNFSLLAVAEKARSRELDLFLRESATRQATTREMEEKMLEKLEHNYSSQTLLLARLLEEATGLEPHITILGSLVRGGAPTAADRILATQLAEWSARMIMRGEFGRMACRMDGVMASVALEEISGQVKRMAVDHGWLRGACQLGTCLGIETDLRA